MVILLSCIALILMVVPLIALYCVIISLGLFFQFSEILKIYHVLCHSVECPNVNLGPLARKQPRLLDNFQHADSVFELRYY